MPHRHFNFDTVFVEYIEYTYFSHSNVTEQILKSNSAIHQIDLTAADAPAAACLPPAAGN